MSIALAAPPSPYKGLAAFEDSDLDALLFFGRERESEVIAANLIASRITVLYGPSGVGKSSVLRAGVAYRLRREQGGEAQDIAAERAGVIDAHGPPVLGGDALDEAEVGLAPLLANRFLPALVGSHLRGVADAANRRRNGQ